MDRKGVGTVLLTVLCIASLGLAGANVMTPDAGPAEALGGETDPALTGDGAPLEDAQNGETTDNETDEVDGQATETGAGAAEKDNGPGAGSGADADDDAYDDSEAPDGDEPGDADRASDDDSDGEDGFDGEADDADADEGEDGETDEPDSDEDPADEDDAEGQTGDSDEDAQRAEGGTAGGSYDEVDTVGGPLELGQQEELVVEAPELTKLRLGAYTTYTGDGWERDAGDRERVTGPIGTDGADDPEPQYEIRVTTRRSFESLATAWRPAYADAERDVYVDDNRGLTVDEPFEANESYSTVTYGPPSDAEAREASGDAYPDEIKSRYTQLPADTPDRLEAHTDEITADAETPYEAATVIESWLKENKDYSLSVNHDPDNDVADEFVFEMEAGYCEYFATAMTTMLRTQDIPARYVTGYGYGEEIDDDRYLLRGENAHAWVEVYFEDVGWVTFDPTPSDGRQDAGRDAQRTENGDEPAEEDDQQDHSGDEESESEQEDDQSDGPDEEEADADDDDDRETHGEDERDDAGPLEVSVAPDPVPGAEVTVTVTQDDSPVPDAEVFFNDESIGTTDASGQTTGEVPYEAVLEETAQRNGGTDHQHRYRYGNAPAGWWAFSSTPEPPESRSQRGNARTELGSDDSTEQGTISFDLETNISLTIPADNVPGTDMDVRADIAGVPVADARVEVADATVRTDADGVATVPVPFQREADVTATKGDAFGNESVFVLYDLSLDVPDEAGAGTKTEVAVTVADEPVSEALVEVGNESVTTGSNGTVTVELPFDEEATVTAERGEFTDRAEIQLNTDLEVAVDGRVAPGFEATVTVTNDGDPLEGVPVALSGTEYATTDADGEATVRPLLLGTSTTVVAERGAAYGSAGLYSVWPYWLAYGAGLAVVVAIVAWRAGLVNGARRTPGRAVSVLRTVATAINRTIRWVAVAAVELTVTVIQFLRRTVARIRRWISAAARDLTGTLIRTAGRVREWFVMIRERVNTLVVVLRDPAAWRAAALWLAALPERVVTAIRHSGQDDTDRNSIVSTRLSEMDSRTVHETLEEWLDEEPHEEDVDYFKRIVEAWEELETTAGRRPEWTPTEVAEHARRQGYPPESIEDLTRMFQRIRYGNRRPTAEMAAKASNAAQALSHEEAD